MADNKDNTAIIYTQKYDNDEKDTTITTKNDKKIIINNTLSVTHSHFQNGIDAVPLLSQNANANIAIKDRNDGAFKTLYIDDNDLYIVPSTGGVDSAATHFIRMDGIDTDLIEYVRKDGLSSDLGNITTEIDNNMIFSNMYLAEDGIIYLLNSANKPTNVSDTIGFTVQSGNIKFTNFGSSSWTDLGTGGNGGGAGELNDLTDVTLSARSNNHILRYDDTTSVFINEKLNISFDTTPTLGGNLSITGSNGLVFDNSSPGLMDNTGNTIVRISDSNTINNAYFELNHNISNMPEITVNGTSADIDFIVSAKGAGDIEMNGSNLELNISNINLNSLTTLNFNSGFVRNAINTLIETGLSTTEVSPTTLNSNYNIILFNISGNNGIYYTLLDDGVNGQGLNIIYETNGSNNTVHVDFNSKFGSGSGLYDRLTFDTAGQGSNMIYLGGLGSRNRWQALNTGGLLS